MSLQVEKLEHNMAKLTIEVGPDELEKALEKAYQKNKGRISVPGFRKGKVPRKLIEKMYGPEVFYEEAANELIPDAYDKALEECEEEIVSSPKIEVTEIEAGKGFVFTAEVALKPAVTLGKYKGAAKLFLAGAENGDPLCQEKIADYYAEGKGILQCTELSVHYIQLAADQNNAQAQLKLANRYSLGDGVRLDKKVAFNWYQKAANSEDPAAMNALAECYHLGDGCLKNDALAISWWQKAANNGNTPAMIHLAENLTEPNNNQVKPDLVTAKYWWTKAAESGDAYAMYRLGDCYEKGLGVSNISLEDAFKWYRLGAQNGDQDAIDASQRFTKSLTGKVKLKKM